MTHKLARSLALTFVPLTITAVACSSNGSNAAAPSSPSTTAAQTTPPTEPTPASTACADASANPSAKPPSNVPTPTDATFYQKVPQGATTQYFAYAPGTDVRQRRDAIKTQLSTAGYDIKGSDAEGNEEADLEFEGKGHGESSIQVIHREGCESQLRLRYKLGH